MIRLFNEKTTPKFTPKTYRETFNEAGYSIDRHDVIIATTTASTLAKFAIFVVVLLMSRQVDAASIDAPLLRGVSELLYASSGAIGLNALFTFWKMLVTRRAAQEAISNFWETTRRLDAENTIRISTETLDRVSRGLDADFNAIKGTLARSIQAAKSFRPDLIDPDAIDVFHNLACERARCEEALNKVVPWSISDLSPPSSKYKNY